MQRILFLSMAQYTEANMQNAIVYVCVSNYLACAKILYLSAYFP
jgi:hypothetical protein